jgi:hypothetical protein
MTTTTNAVPAAGLRRATAHGMPAIAARLPRTFFDDPAFRWASPDDERRRELLPGFFSPFVRMLRRCDETNAVGEVTGPAPRVPPERRLRRPPGARR